MNFTLDNRNWYALWCKFMSVCVCVIILLFTTFMCSHVILVEISNAQVSGRPAAIFTSPLILSVFLKMYWIWTSSTGVTENIFGELNQQRKKWEKEKKTWTEHTESFLNE